MSIMDFTGRRVRKHREDLNKIEVGDFYEEEVKKILDNTNNFEDVKIVDECYDVSCNYEGRQVKIEVKFNTESNRFFMDAGRYCRLKDESGEVWVFYICKDRIFPFSIDNIEPGVFVSKSFTKNLTLKESNIRFGSKFIEESDEIEGWSDLVNHSLNELKRNSEDDDGV